MYVHTESTSKQVASVCVLRHHLAFCCTSPHYQDFLKANNYIDPCSVFRNWMHVIILVSYCGCALLKQMETALLILYPLLLHLQCRTGLILFIHVLPLLFPTWHVHTLDKWLPNRGNHSGGPVPGPNMRERTGLALWHQFFYFHYEFGHVYFTDLCTLRSDWTQQPESFQQSRMP